MSLILDALRKLERDKDAREPGVVVVGSVPWGEDGPGAPGVLALAAAALLALLAGAWWLLRRRPARGGGAGGRTLPASAARTPRRPGRLPARRRPGRPRLPAIAPSPRELALPAPGGAPEAVVEGPSLPPPPRPRPRRRRPPHRHQPEGRPPGRPHQRPAGVRGRQLRRRQGPADRRGRGRGRGARQAAGRCGSEAALPGAPAASTPGGSLHPGRDSGWPASIAGCTPCTCGARRRRRWPPRSRGCPSRWPGASSTAWSARTGTASKACGGSRRPSPSRSGPGGASTGWRSSTGGAARVDPFVKYLFRSPRRPGVRGGAHPAREAALQRVPLLAGRLRPRLPLLRDRAASASSATSSPGRWSSRRSRSGGSPPSAP